MKSSLRKILVAPVAAAALLALSACGGGSGSSDDKVTIGFVAPLKGSNADTAEMMVNAAKLAVAQANEDGGIDGKDIELKVYDDELSPDVASRVATRAITVDEVAVLVGGLSSAEGLAIREVAERNKVVYLASASSSPGITDGAKYTFRVAATAIDQARAVAEITQALGSKKAGILADNGAVGPALAGMFEQFAKEISLPLSGKPIEYALAGTDMSGPVRSLGDQGADAVMIGGSTGADHGLIAKTMVEQGVDIPIIGLVGVGFPDAFEVGGDAYDKLPGAYFPASVDTEKPAFKEFKEACEAEYDAKQQYPDAAVQSYDATRIAIQALIDTKGDGAGDKLAEAITGLEPLDGAAGSTGSTISFADSHDGFGGSFLVTYQAKGGSNQQVTIE
jgi:branched-chain amino acid transport system substrate-binding protein